jgi:hypothetical protein
MSDRANADARTKLLSWVDDVGAVTAPALATLLGSSEASARARLQAAQRAGLLTSVRPLSDGPALHTLTRAGSRALGSGAVGARDAALLSVTAANACHTATCALVAAVLQLAYPQHRVTGERQLRRAEREHGRRLATAVLGSAGASDKEHRPDLVMWPQQERGNTRRPIAVEVELTVKAPRRLTAICRAWARCRHVDGVLYVYASPVGPPLERALANARAAETIRAVSLPALLELASQAAALRDAASP